MSKQPVLVGQFGAAHGIKGWVNVRAFTRPVTNLLEYYPWYDGTGKPLADIEASRVQPKSICVKLADCHDRNSAQALTHQKIYIMPEQLPAPAEGEYYWYQLEGLRVVTVDGQALGVVSGMLETGANDVMLVKGDRERAIPFLHDQVVKAVDLEQEQISVDWDPSF